MNEYAKRTCSNCGLRLPQPQMNQRIVSVQVAKGKRGLSAREVVGTIVGSKKAKNSMFNWLFAPNLRNYTRKQKVWLCDECAGNAPRQQVEQVVDDRKRSKGAIVSISQFWVWFLILASVLAVSDLLSNSQNTGESISDFGSVLGLVILTQLYYFFALVFRPARRKTVTSFAFHYCSVISILTWCLVEDTLSSIWIISFSVINLFLLHRLKKAEIDDKE